MKKIALALTLLLFSKAFADFDRHLFKNSQLLEDSALVEDEKIRLNCFVFKNFIILEKEEPGFLGKVIYFKENKIAKNTDVETYCKDIQIPSFKKLESSGASFYGLYKGFLFVQDPDELSARTKFEVHNLESGQMTFSGVKNNDTMLKIVPVTSKKVALEYYQRYLSDCDFNSSTMKLTCWTDFLKSIKVPEKVQIPYPNCPKSKKSKKYQLFLKVQVPDIQKSKSLFLWSKPICELAP